jgi:hypothetical protein
MGARSVAPVLQIPEVSQPRSSMRTLSEDEWCPHFLASLARESPKPRNGSTCVQRPHPGRGRRKADSRAGITSLAMSHPKRQGQAPTGGDGLVLAAAHAFRSGRLTGDRHLRECRETGWLG